MDKLRDSANLVVNNIQGFVSEFVREKQVLASEAKRLAEYDEAIKAREAKVAGIEGLATSQEEREQRKAELLKLQSENARDFEANDRERKLLASEKEKWLKQKEADLRGIENERQDIRNQNAALAKEKAEYKDKLHKKLKLGV